MITIISKKNTIWPPPLPFPQAKNLSSKQSYPSIQDKNPQVRCYVTLIIIHCMRMYYLFVVFHRWSYSTLACLDKIIRFDEIFQYKNSLFLEWKRNIKITIIYIWQNGSWAFQIFIKITEYIKGWLCMVMIAQAERLPHSMSNIIFLFDNI